jgi:dTDP-4-dehydrorhamnose 3,5-epimerase
VAEAPLPAGVRRYPIDAFPDHRGRFAELYRETWDTGVRPVQWNLMESKAGTLRGVHVHIQHDDYLLQLVGRCDVALVDLRKGSSTEGLATVVTLDAAELVGLTIPHGVAHGLWHPVDSLQVLGVSHYYDKIDEQGCRWDDPALALGWSVTDPDLSERDRTMGSLAELLAVLEPHQPI